MPISSGSIDKPFLLFSYAIDSSFYLNEPPRFATWLMYLILCTSLQQTIQDMSGLSIKLNCLETLLQALRLIESVKLTRHERRI